MDIEITPVTNSIEITVEDDSIQIDLNEDNSIDVVGGE